MGVYDKGKAGTVVETETSLAERGGDVYTKAVGRAFFVGQGNWGGPKGDECYTETYVTRLTKERPKYRQLSSSGRKETRRRTRVTDNQRVCSLIQECASPIHLRHDMLTSQTQWRLQPSPRNTRTRPEDGLWRCYNAWSLLMEFRMPWVVADAWW